MTKYATNQTLGVNFYRADDTPAFPLGTRVEGTDSSVFIYGQAAANMTAGQVAYFDTAWLATLVATAASPFGDMLAVAPAAINANQYGWFQVGGLCDAIQVNAGCAANVRLNTTATAGQLDDDGTAGAKTASGVILTTARGGTAGVAPGLLVGANVGATL